jgi:hypothetical protein
MRIRSTKNYAQLEGKYQDKATGRFPPFFLCCRKTYVAGGEELEDFTLCLLFKICLFL